MSPGRTPVPKKIEDLVAETGDVLLQLLERDSNRVKTSSCQWRTVVFVKIN